MDRDELLHWLRTSDRGELAELWARADSVRQTHIGPAVHLRGLIEISNRCVRHCAYCGINASNHHIPRYDMPETAILACVDRAVECGYGTVVLQAGESPMWSRDRVAALIASIKRRADLAVTLSLGEQDRETLRHWREAGADRYLLRFETSDPALYERIHPREPGAPDRLEILSWIKELGYEAGGGVMVGIPGQTWNTLAQDLLTFAHLDLDMIGIGPYIPHPDTPLGHDPDAWRAPDQDQVPNDEALVYRVLALTRLLCPRANIPSTTALATINHHAGRELGLQRGANILMPNLTPAHYRAMYDIYPAKHGLTADTPHDSQHLHTRIHSLGRTIGTGHGNAPNHHPPPQTPIAADQNNQ
ncbi:MAG: [FeFe] hydrogenase H-cluster radical SAM maturase HydE [Planctomycetota bacterium]